MEDLTNDQEQYINDVYNDLKSRGLSDEVAAFVAGLSTGDLNKKQQNDAKYVDENDEVTYGNALHNYMINYKMMDLYYLLYQGQQFHLQYHTSFLVT